MKRAEELHRLDPVEDHINTRPPCQELAGHYQPMQKMIWGEVIPENRNEA